MLQVTIPAGSPAAGKSLGDIAWPPGWIPATVMDNRTLRGPDPGITLIPGDRVNLLAANHGTQGPRARVMNGSASHEHEHDPGGDSR